MKYSNIFTKTQKELPAKETSKNAELLLRSGFIRKEQAGVYSYLPLGLRVLRKIEHIVREEMDNFGVQEILMPALANKESWEKTNRWDSMDCLYKIEMAGGQEGALSPTHEETVTPLVQYYANSYKDFPLAVYQIQSKFRNEARAKSGLLRGREFLMKDAYSFHLSQEDFEQYYENMKDVYMRIYKRLGIGDITKIVAASGGDFSKHSHEFQTLCEIGEDSIYVDTKTGEAFNKEIAQGKADDKNSQDAEVSLEKLPTPRGFNIEESAKAHNVEHWQVLKSVVFQTENSGLVLVAIRGDLEVNELLLVDLIGEKIRPATEEELHEARLVQGFISPVETELTVYGDESLKTVKNFVTGANEKDADYVNANLDRDFKVDTWGNFAFPTEHFTTPQGNPLTIEKAIEVGNIFPLSIKFSKPFGFLPLGEDGKPREVIMGCYGIGISRIMGSLVEIFHDDRGIKWPSSVAPFQVYLAGIGKSDTVYETCEKLYKDLNKAGIETFYDDRRDKKVGPGQKFADHELMGLPYRVVISERGLEAGEAEIVSRETGEMEKIKIEDIVKFFKK
jgi:prolyl-tRNA synthetase